MTLMRKFLDILNMDNWQPPKNIEPDPNPNKPVPVDFPIERPKECDIAPVLPINPAPVSEEPPSTVIVSTFTPNTEQANGTKLNINYEVDDFVEDLAPYISKRLIIPGLHIQFIDIARDIIHDKKINVIPLMREYNISEDNLMQIIDEIFNAHIIDADNNVLMDSESFEKFIDIYEPNLFVCPHTVFDKDIFECLGEIIFDNGIEVTYSSLPADELIDYLNIMESLKIIKYDSYENKYNIISSEEEFHDICKSIPEYFGSKKININSINIKKDNIDAMTGIEFENYAAYLLHKNGFTDIKKTPISGDHGIDLTAVKNEISYAIQCKCYSSNIGNSAVQQAHTGKSLYHKDIAVVLTNQYFTTQAKEEAAALGVKLWDRDTLTNMISNANMSKKQMGVLLCDEAPNKDEIISAFNSLE